jgi:hypothetical protein
MVKRLTQVFAAALLAITFSGGAIFAQSTIENTGPGSTNEINHNNNCEADIDNDTDINIDNNNDQNANSGNNNSEEGSSNGGNATNNGNTTGGNSGSGDASNDNNTDVNIDVDNSTGNPCLPCEDCDEQPETPTTTTPEEPGNPSNPGEVAGITTAAVGGADIAALPYTAGETNLPAIAAASVATLLVGGTLASRLAVAFLQRR